MTETLMIYISLTTSFIFLSIGVLFGWIAAEVKQEHMYNVQEEQSVHPEMLNSHGQWINEELLSVRFLNEDEIEEE
mgnify:FL=1|jgi:hypothetical protein|tara:strand:+ start:274 stop:501 length:228 start_codon:yes stop_codon:yes gene_type:complete